MLYHKYFCSIWSIKLSQNYRYLNNNNRYNKPTQSLNHENTYLENKYK